MKPISLIILRIVLAFSFIYPAIMAHVHPDTWMSFFPRFVTDLNIPATTLFVGFSIVHGIIALWILINKKVHIAAIIAALFIANVLIFNVSQFELLFRDVAILTVAIVIAIETYPRKKFTF
jgi:hypothetical protein